MRVKQPYKICVYWSFFSKNYRYTIREHYTGFCLEEAVAKVRNKLAWAYVIRDKDTKFFASIANLRTGRGGGTIKWLDYHSSGELADVWNQAVKDERSLYMDAQERLRARGY